MVTKAHILAEIKRTAEANGGRPLGRARFEAETGIKASDWSGKYWINWSEIIREAGYAPNQLTRSLDDAGILEKYAQYACDLGHLPVAGELRLRRRTDRTFPSHGVFSRFGTKAELVARVREYCRSNAVHSDVIHLCGEYLSQAQREPSSEPECPPEAIGYVYLNKVRFKGRWLYYIGRTDSLGRRENEHYRKFQNLKPIHAIPTPHPPAAEKYWHARFAAKRVHNSIFDLSKSDVAAFKKCKSM